MSYVTAHNAQDTLWLPSVVLMSKGFSTEQSSSN